MTFVVLALVSSAAIALIELMKRRLHLKASLTRQLAHLSTSFVAAFGPLAATKDEVVIVSLVFAAAFLALRRSSLLSAIHGVERRTYGDLFLPLGVAIAAFALLPDIPAYQFGVLIMGVSDAVAGFVGERYGRHPLALFGVRKSVEGTAAFAASATGVLALFAPLSPAALLIPPILAIIEASLALGFDNLVLPLFAGLLLQALGA